MYMSEEILPLFKNVIAVTNRHLCQRPFEEQIERVVSCRPKAVILREKDLAEEDYLILARSISELCRAYEVPCILHTYWKAAISLSSKAIHLPLPALRAYRSEKGSTHDFQVIGTSVHSLEDALEACTLGASYITAGHIYATDCKKGVPPRGTSFLKEICRAVDIPVYGIGGIRLDRMQLQEVMACGAQGGCIMSEMMRV